jgi:hypothetical protein
MKERDDRRDLARWENEGGTVVDLALLARGGRARRSTATARLPRSAAVEGRKDAHSQLGGAASIHETE